MMDVNSKCHNRNGKIESDTITIQCTSGLTIFDEFHYYLYFQNKEEKDDHVISASSWMEHF